LLTSPCKQNRGKVDSRDSRIACVIWVMVRIGRSATGVLLEDKETAL
jgi:hypothetical protein